MALQERTRDRVPGGWANTQYNLGLALLKIGWRERTALYFEEAVIAFRDALKEYTRERMPLQWADAQNNLANALTTLARFETGAAKLDAAVAAYRKALAVFQSAGSVNAGHIQKNLEVAERLLRERR